MARIAIINRKGGVGKTTTAHSLAHALALKGKRVLAIDCDSQANLTTWLGFEDPEDYSTLVDVAAGRAAIGETILGVRGNLDLIPASAALLGLHRELEAARVVVPQMWLSQQLQGLRLDRWDYILFDTGPNLDLNTTMAMLAADSVLIATQAAPLALRGLNEMLGWIESARLSKPSLALLGCVVCAYDGRTVAARDCWKLIRELPDLEGRIRARIRRSVRMEETPGQPVAVSIFDHDVDSKPAQDYRQLAAEVLAHG